MELVNYFVDYCTDFITSGGPLFGFLLIILESVIPALPLGVFVALNINSFGFLFGLILSWIATCVGCYLSYLLFNYLSNNFIYKFFKENNRKKIEKATIKFKKIPFSNLVVIIALPFTPAFLINIIAGMSNIPKKKYLIALLIGKIFMIFFWAYVGKSLIESVTDIKTIIIVSIMILLAYFISKLVSKKMNIE